MKAVKAKWVVQSCREIRENAAILMEDGIIMDVLPNDKVEEMVRTGRISAEDVEDRSNCILFPGFVNAHMHQYGVLSHGIPLAGKVTDFSSFLTEYWWPYIEDRIRKEQVLVTARATMAEMLSSGITAFCDILEAPFTEADTLIAQGEEIERAGMRGIVSLESSFRAGEEIGRACLKQNGEAAEYFRKKGGRVRGAVCTHTTFTCPEAFIEEAAALAREKEAFLQFHLSESRYEPEWLVSREGIRPAQLYQRAGALGAGTIASQCVKTDAGELALLRESGTKVVHMPVSNCEVGGGIAPVPAMLELGLEPALGTDGYVNDFFQVMRAAFLIHKAAMESTEVMPAAAVFCMATEYGARAMGLKDCGLLHRGFQADFVVYEEKQPTPVTAGNLLDQLVVFGNRNQVADVYIGGRPVMKDHRLLTLDGEAAGEELRRCARDFWKDVR